MAAERFSLRNLPMMERVLGLFGIGPRNRFGTVAERLGRTVRASWLPMLPNLPV